MLDKTETIEALTQLNLTEYGTDWVNDIWLSDFSDVDQLPSVTCSCNTELLKLLLGVLEPWSEEQLVGDSEGLWTVLVEENIPYKNLVAVIFWTMETALQKGALVGDQEMGIYAASIYLTLLKIPGSGAFKIFHPVLFEKAINMFRIWLSNDAENSKRKRSLPDNEDKNKRKRSRGRTGEDISHGDEELDDVDEDEGEDNILSADQMHSLNRALNKLLQVFIQLLETFQTSKSERTQKLTVQTLAHLSKKDSNKFNGEFHNRPVTQMKTVSEMAFKGLEVCTENARDQASMLIQVLKNIIPNILMLPGNNHGGAAAAIPKSALTIRDHTVNFIVYMTSRIPADIMMPSLRMFIQHVCVNCPDKTDYRIHVSQTINELLMMMPAPEGAKMIEWIYRFSRNQKIAWRSVGVDVVGSLVREFHKDSAEVSPEMQVFLQPHFLLQALVARCSDVAPGVRTRAITILGQCVACESNTIQDVIRDMITPANRIRIMSRIMPTPDKNVDLAKDNRDIVNQERDENRFQQEVEPDTPHAIPPNTAMTTIQLNSGLEITLTDGEGLMSMLCRRTGDDKVFVRKAAIQTLAEFLAIAPDINVDHLHIIEERCRDLALSIRKQALSSLTSLLLSKPSCQAINKAWLCGVLPMIIDRETSVQEKCLQSLEEVILDNIKPANRSMQLKEKLAWSLLQLMSNHEYVELRRYLQIACQFWGKSGKLKTPLIKSLHSHINTDNNNGAWMLLAEITPFCPNFDPQFIVEYWKGNSSITNLDDNYITEKVLVVISHIAKNMNDEDSRLLADDMKQRLMKFNSPPELTSATVAALSKLCLRDSNRLTDCWFGDLLSACDEYLSATILNQNTDSSLNEDDIIRHLFTLGEIAQICPAQTPKRVFLLVQSLIAAPVISTDAATSNSQMSGSAPGINHVETGSQPLSQISQDVLSQFRGSKMSKRIRAHAFITLGKLCLQNEDLAKKCIAALARELEVSSDASVRNNVLVVMSDLCIRYTTLVERYLPSISSCLMDRSPLIRKQCLTLLTRLLQEDFLKWKGNLFYHFVLTLVDQIESIATFAEFCLVHLLMQRHPAMFYQHFIECIFFFNNYQQHSVYNKFADSVFAGGVFSLVGTDNRLKRLHIYNFLLKHMVDEHKFQLTAKLCHDVLSVFVDGVMPLNADSMPILQDTLTILISQEIKLSTKQQKAQDDVPETDQEMAAIVLNTARKTLISQVVRKNVIENIVPTVIALKHVLEKNHSPALGDLMAFLNELMKDYKTEVKDVMSADPQLAKEIEYDLHRFTEQRKQPILCSRQGIADIVQNPASTADRNPATPARRPPTNDVINSARKALNTLHLNTPVSKTTASRKVGFKSPEPTETVKHMTPECQRIKKSGRLLRAISTPSANITLSDITFRQDLNLSMIPMSPVVSLPESSSDEQEALINMMSPDRPRTKPTQWNIKTPKQSRRPTDGRV